MSKRIILNSFQGEIQAETVEFTHEDEKYKGALFTISIPLAS